MRDPRELNVIGVDQLISSRLNKNIPDKPIPEEGPSDNLEGELELSMSDEELRELADQWELDYAPYEQKINQRQATNKYNYLGKESSDTSLDVPIANNILFEAEETFLPTAMSKNPEPVVFSDNTVEGKELSNNVKTMLQYHADVLNLRQKLKKMTRHWSIYYIAAIKHGWDPTIDDICSDIVFPKNLILDKDATIDDSGNYDGYYIGERKKCSAQKLSELFPKKAGEIKITVDGKMGTKCTYTEWWTADYCFYTYKEIILAKNKNPNWNYPDKQEPTEDGQPKATPDRNHFAKRMMPYTFMSVFNLGEHPHDDTTLIEQNISNQANVTARMDQINMNLAHANNGIAVSGDFFTVEQAKEAGRAIQKGHPIWVPSGDVRSAVVRLPAPPLPSGAFEQLEHMEMQLRSIFGTLGSSPAGQDSTDTVRGKIMNQQYDTTRTSGGVGDVIEQVADNIFNWWVQLYYVYYDVEHVGAILGRSKSVEYVTLQSTDINRKLVVSVSPDSMKPKDELTEMNQAMDLWNAGAIDPKTLFTMLNFPDPTETAKNLFLWKTNPAALFADVMQEQQAQGGAPQQPQGAPQEQGVPGEPPQGNSLAAPPASPDLSQVPIQPL